MKPIKLILTIAVTVGLVQLVVAKNPHDKRSLSKSSNIDHDTFIDANNLLMFVTNEGSFAWNLITGGGGLEYPKGTGKSAIFASGLWVGGKVDGETRVTVAEYSFEYQPGVILPDGTPEETDENRLAKNRVYKITSKSSSGDEDWDEWPVADGAPLDADGNPLLLGDQALWTVYNDADAAKHDNMASAPLGIEVQHYTWAYNRQGALSNMLFFELTVINKGSNTIEETYLTLWSDPDLGQFDDDLVGADTTLGLGYCYNSSNSDAEYGSAPPAVGYDFLQGPVVPSTGDTARVFDVTTLSFQEILDHKNIPMVAFNKYINGADPSVPKQAYAFMIGKNRDGTDIFDPDGNLTTFVLAGDPVTGTGWIDSNPADRRFLMSAGPFTMAPGDTQKIVAAIIMGQGSDRLSSITALKANDLVAQRTFDNSFKLPDTPPTPVVSINTYDRTAVLSWDNAADFDASPDVGATIGTGDDYFFEGFNVYQGESIAGPWHKVATFDKVNGITVIRDRIFNSDEGTEEEVVVQSGTDAGIQHYMVIDRNFLTGGGLFNGSTYYYAVTAYSYNPNGDLGLTLETAINPEVVTISPQLSGTSYDVESIDGMAATPNASAAESVGDIGFSVIDPSQVKADDYKIVIIDPPEDDENLTLWSVISSAGDTLVNRSVSGSGIVGGVLVSIDGQVTPARRRVYRGDDPFIEMDVVTSTDADLPDSMTLNWNVTISSWAGGAYIGVGENVFGPPKAYSDPIRVEFDFTDPAKQQWGRELNKVQNPLVYDDITFRIPFRVFNDRTGVQLYAEIFDNAGDPQVWDPTDFLIFTSLPYDAAWDADSTLVPRPNNLPKEDKSVYTYFISFFPDSEGTVERYRVNSGDIIKLTPPRILEPGDEFTFSFVDIASFDEETAKSELEKILVVPNPYYAHSSYETNVLLTRIVKFTHMPETATIRIFNLAGDLVRKIEHSNTTGFEVWNLKNSSEIFVASGIYIYHIDAGNLGTVIGKMAVFIEEERLQLY